jgi:pimeloyl-ACP methyl ester carboxylesterase
VASDSGHWIHLDHPELVTRAIREVVAAACSLRFPSSNL